MQGHRCPRVNRRPVRERVCLIGRITDRPLREVKRLVAAILEDNILVIEILTIITLRIGVNRIDR